MDKRIKIGLGAVAGAAAVSLPVRAALFKEKNDALEPLPAEDVDLERYRKNLSDAIRIRTIASKDPQKMDFGPFDEFHAFLRERYPRLHEKLELTEVIRGPLLFRWKGKNAGLDPIALLAHQDVVPISEGTWDDWTHPPFDGVDDGEFIWGRGALDMKNHLIGVCEAVEALLAEGFEPERDVYLCFGHNEEVMCGLEGNGAIEMCKYFKAKGIRLDAVLDEGGAILPVHVKGVIDKDLAGIGVAEKGCSFLMLIPSAFMQSMSAVVAQNAGAGKYDRALKCLKYAIMLSSLFGVVMFYLAFFHGDLLAWIFSKEEQIIFQAADYLKAYGIDCLLTCFLFCFIGFFNGMGATRFVMIQGATAAFLIRVPVAIFMSRWEPVSLFHIGLGIPCSTVYQIILCFIFLAILKKKLNWKN